MIALFILAQTVNLTCTADLAAKPRTIHCVEVPSCAPCPEPTPTPKPTPTPPLPSPTPFPGPIIDPVTGNFPLPAEGTCPRHFNGSLDQVGVQFRSRVPVKTQGGLYLGWRYNFDATPKSRPPFCPHALGRLTCEQWTACQPAEGFDFYLTLPGRFTNERCDNFSAEPYWCHHKPKANERGPTTVCAVPKGAASNDPRGSCITVNVQP